MIRQGSVNTDSWEIERYRAGDTWRYREIQRYTEIHGDTGRYMEIQRDTEIQR